MKVEERRMIMRIRKNKNMKKAESIAKQWQEQDRINSDILGSYTGTSADPDLIPEQDADDL